LAELAGRLRALLAGERQTFVLVSLGVNLLFLVRSYATMQLLDYRGLGLAALLQSVMLLIGALHFGIINGGYRLICAADGEEAARLNDFVFSFIGGLALAALVVGGMLRLLNRVNFWSAAGSLVALGYAVVDPLPACLAAIVLQPAFFLVAALCADRRLLPRRIEVDRRLIRNVLHAGFIVFLTGIFLQVNVQIERWYVTAYLGLDALGHLYLAILFVTLFQLVPTSFDQIYLPAVVREHAADSGDGLARIMRQFFLVVAGYCALAAIAVALLARPVTALILPQYVGDLRYVYLIAPGMILFTLGAPLAIMFNVLIRYRTYFIAYGIGTLVTAGVVAWAILSGTVLSLDAVALLRSGAYALMAALLVAGFLVLSREHRRFRFRFRRNSPRP
jgi:O-antigen/teichoic acid export membrane protein